MAGIRNHDSLMVYTYLIGISVPDGSFMKISYAEFQEEFENFKRRTASRDGSLGLLRTRTTAFEKFFNKAKEDLQSIATDSIQDAIYDAEELIKKNFFDADEMEERKEKQIDREFNNAYEKYLSAIENLVQNNEIDLQAVKNIRKGIYDLQVNTPRSKNYDSHMESLNELFKKMQSKFFLITDSEQRKKFHYLMLDTKNKIHLFLGEHNRKDKNKFDKWAIQEGPLNKSQKTKDFENLIKQILDGKKVQINREDEAAPYVEFKLANQVVKFYLHDMKEVDFTHLKFTKEYLDSYASLVVENMQGLVGLPDCPGVPTNDDFIARDIDNSVSHLKYAEKLAINIYSGGYYDSMNKLLRGDFDFSDAKEDRIKELLLHVAIMAHGLSRRKEMVSRPDFLVRNTVSIQVPEAFRENTANSVLTKDHSFISSHQDQNEANNPPYEKAGIKLVIENPTGLNVVSLSQHPTENEWIIATAQLLFLGLLRAQCDVYLAKEVRTPGLLLVVDESQQMAPEQSKGSSLAILNKLHADGSPNTKRHLSVNRMVTDDSVNESNSHNTTPKPARRLSESSGKASCSDDEKKSLVTIHSKPSQRKR
jgi:hypothetical protein